MIGKKFGMLKVIEECEGRDKQGHIVYKCICDCGNIKNVNKYHLIYGMTKSCGCLVNKHGKTQTMKQWAEELNIKYGMIKTRHNRGWSDKECLFGKGVN